MSRIPIEEKNKVDYVHTSLENLLSHEISQIDDINVVNIVRKVLKRVPKEHSWKPASSSNKYHPLCDLGIGGLVRHTKVVVKIIQEIINATPVFKDEKDDLIAAAILHDMMKYPNSSYIHTSIKHPDLIADIIAEEGSENIARLARSHQGIFTKSKNEPNIENSVVPKKFDEWALHYADLISSRCFVNFEFDEVGEIKNDLWKERSK